MKNLLVVFILIGIAIWAALYRHNANTSLRKFNSSKEDRYESDASIKSQSTEDVYTHEVKRAPNVYLPNENAPVLTAGAGFRGTIVRLRLEYAHTKRISAGVAIYAGNQKVGYTIVTIKKGELEGEQETRLDGFMGLPEHKIPSYVNLRITSVSEGYWKDSTIPQF